MPRPRQISDEQIIEVARACCLELGPAVSTSVIAERLGVSQAVLFQRFGTKEKLLRAALEPPREVPWIELANAGPDQRELREQLGELARAVFAFFDEISPRLAVLRVCGMGMPHWEGQAEPPPLRSHRALVGWLERAQRQGRARACNAHHLAYVFLGSLQVQPWFEHVLGKRLPSADRHGYIDIVVELLWRSLEPEAKAPSRPRGRRKS